ncbi:related to DNA excision repair ERCC-8 [Lecanosticta acicola]|uniref:Related to DNA excision repair ERCC-8 n=1 Tax=Lecanosticta acicola TaxID=111012 RepID=A0AAI9E4V6_9PEZI|nr:related to DNA excision repair ERCC-8 [Lecanosticta acicola]
MNSFLLNRQLGSISPQALAKAQNNRLLKALAAAPDVNFALQDAGARASNTAGIRDVAHAAGVNSIAIDRFEGRYMISGGADSSLGVWDLEAAARSSDDRSTHLPLGFSARTSTTQSLGITHISFYPFDSLALLTSGYDHTLKLFSSETLEASASFDIGSTVYSHATSTVAPHLLVACASQHPAIRLVDLKSGANTHSLAGHSGSVLAVAWHPKDENILASGATDGVVRLWDIRRGASSLGVLDMDDSIGITGYDGRGTGARRRERGRSHTGAVNGIVWTEDGRYLVSNGHDERMRIWNMYSGANTLANFGPGLKNATTTALFPLIAPSYLCETGKETLFYPNSKEILAFDMHSGLLQSRLRIKGLPGLQDHSDTSTRNPKNRTTCLAWRAHHVEMYSAHGDGSIRCWRPRTTEDVVAENEQAGEHDVGEDAAERKRKRDEFEEIVKDLTSKKITFN